MEQPQDQSHLDGWVAVWRRMAWSHCRLYISSVKQLRLLGCSLHSISPAYSSWYWKGVVGMLSHSPVSISVSSLVITWAINKSLLKKQLVFKNKHQFYWDLVLHALIRLILHNFIFITCRFMRLLSQFRYRIGPLQGSLMPSYHRHRYLPYSSLIPLPYSSLTMKVKLKVKVAQSCPTLCDPMDCSLPGSSVHGIFQAKILEWVAISFSRKVILKVRSWAGSSGHWRLSGAVGEG